MHEIMHWQFVDLGGVKALADTHLHGHGDWCGEDVQTELHLLIEEIRHLATYSGDDGTCGHRKKLALTVDAYALFGMAIGEDVRDGHLAYWPQPADPTPQPPECSDEPGCLCTPVDYDEEPDGDGDPELYCSDHQGETTCQLTEVNAGATVGICTLCSEVRGAGCACDEFLECDVGSCWGADTRLLQGGGVGHCYRDPPPEYQCLADCETLLYDEAAWCYNEYPGGARCMDLFCEPWAALDCHGQGKVCRDGECVSECGYDEEDVWVLKHPLK